MRCVVTGGAGFIGSNLVDALVRRGDEVVVVDDLSSGKRGHINAAVTFVEGDIRDGIDAAGADVVFHLAAQADVQTSMRRPDHDAAVPEDSPLQPVSPYGIAKLCAEEYLRGWNRIHGSGHVVLRLANVYGPRQDSSLEGGVVAIFLERMARGEDTLIFGDGLQTRDFVYVGDVVGALLAAAGHDGGTFNIGTGEETTVLELHRLCAEVSGSKAEPAFEPARLGDARRSVLDVSS